MNKIDSPCVRNCCLDEQDICMGCFRSLEEIKVWQASSDKEKKGILRLAEKRRSIAHKNTEPFQWSDL